jgi:hypothetical protein
VHFEPHTNLVTSRSVYVPSDGRFIRYVDRASNPTSLDINVTMSTMGQVQSANLAAYLPSSKGTPLDDLGVLTTNGYAIGLAIGGPGAAVVPQAAWLPDPYINYGWGPFVVHPGETK